MATLKEQIREAEQEIRAREDAIKAWKLRARELEAERANCHHEFTRAMVGYEHEGGECIYCGINEVYAECQKIGAKYK